MDQATIPLYPMQGHLIKDCKIHRNLLTRFDVKVAMLLSIPKPCCTPKAHLEKFGSVLFEGHVTSTNIISLLEKRRDIMSTP